jgi:hypothetical protein
MAKEDPNVVKVPGVDDQPEPHPLDAVDEEELEQDDDFEQPDDDDQAEDEDQPQLDAEDDEEEATEGPDSLEDIDRALESLYGPKPAPSEPAPLPPQGHPPVPEKQARDDDFDEFDEDDDVPMTRAEFRKEQARQQEQARRAAQANEMQHRTKLLDDAVTKQLERYSISGNRYMRRGLQDEVFKHLNSMNRQFDDTDIAKVVKLVCRKAELSSGGIKSGKSTPRGVGSRKGAGGSKSRGSRKGENKAELNLADTHATSAEIDSWFND